MEKFHVFHQPKSLDRQPSDCTFMGYVMAELPSQAVEKVAAKNGKPSKGFEYSAGPCGCVERSVSGNPLKTCKAARV